MQNNLDADHVVVTTAGTAGIVRLNRPRAINSLTGEMVRDMKTALEGFAKDPSIGCVILDGEGEKGLCAGGDVRQIYDTRALSDEEKTRFWRDEFPLNETIAHYRKPYIAFMDGIVMGGGVGISAHGSHRIVTERTRLAMPETAIGYFPDVGATWLLPRAPGQSGTWLGLTGTEIGAADAIHMGLADDYVLSQHLPALADALGQAHVGEDLGKVIGRFASTPAEGALTRHAAAINAIFAPDRVEEIVSALKDAAAHEPTDTSFWEATLSALQARSPTSLKLTLKLLRKGRDSSGLVECLEREFAAGCHVLRGHDFFEGVRAALVDKDRSPKWVPARLEDVEDHDIDRFLIPTLPPLFPDHRQ